MRSTERSGAVATAPRHLDARVRDADVDARRSAAPPRDRPLERARVRRVGLEDRGALPELGGERLHAVGLEADEGDVRPLAVEPARALGPDPAGRARDQDGPAVHVVARHRPSVGRASARCASARTAGGRPARGGPGPPAAAGARPGARARRRGSPRAGGVRGAARGRARAARSRGATARRAQKPAAVSFLTTISSRLRELQPAVRLGQRGARRRGVEAHVPRRRPRLVAAAPAQQLRAPGEVGVAGPEPHVLVEDLRPDRAGVEHLAAVEDAGAVAAERRAARAPARPRARRGRRARSCAAGRSACRPCRAPPGAPRAPMPVARSRLRRDRADPVAGERLAAPAPGSPGRARSRR